VTKEKEGFVNIDSRTKVVKRKEKKRKEAKKLNKKLFLIHKNGFFKWGVHISNNVASLDALDGCCTLCQGSAPSRRPLQRKRPDRRAARCQR
jgi:hypothetical protein